MELHQPAAAANTAPQPRDLRALTAKDLVSELARKASMLARKEVELAKVEAREQLRAEVKMARGLGVAGVCALTTIHMLLVALVFGLAEGGVLAGWQAALIVAAVVLTIGTVAGLLGWKRRVRKPLPATRRSLQESSRWARERLA